MVPSELTGALKAFGSALGGGDAGAAATPVPAAAGTETAPPEAVAAAAATALPEAASMPDATEAIAAAHEALERVTAEATSAEGSGDGALDGLAPASTAGSAGTSGTAVPA